jgi:hypothetical protein
VLVYFPFISYICLFCRTSSETKKWTREFDADKAATQNIALFSVSHVISVLDGLLYLDILTKIYGVLYLDILTKICPFVFLTKLIATIIFYIIPIGNEKH